MQNFKAESSRGNEDLPLLEKMTACVCDVLSLCAHVCAHVCTAAHTKAPRPLCVRTHSTARTKSRILLINEHVFLKCPTLLKCIRNHTLTCVFHVGALSGLRRSCHFDKIGPQKSAFSVGTHRKHCFLWVWWNTSSPLGCGFFFSVGSHRKQRLLWVSFCGAIRAQLY